MLLEENILKHAQTRKGEKEGGGERERERKKERKSLAQLAAKVTV
jgi:hypothetical protein